jgi:hypothetical protein
MRIQYLAAIVAVGMAVGPAPAQDAKPAQPTIEFRLRSINDLLDKGEFAAGMVGQEETVKSVKSLLKFLTKEKEGLEGIDTTRPFGMYANLDMDVANSPVTLMIPIADKDRFLKLLKDRAEIAPEKAEDGTLKIFVPIVNELYLRFTSDYLYIGRTVKDLDPKTIIAPKTFFNKQDPAIGSLIIRFDQIPGDVKSFVIGQFELTTAEQRKRNGANEQPAEKAFLDWLGDALTGGLKTFLEDARELNVRVFIDEKSEELGVEATLTAKPGSTFAKNLASFGGQMSIPAGIVAASNAAVQASAKGGLTPELKKRFSKVVDDVGAAIVDKADPNSKAVARQAVDVLSPTFKAANVDAAFSLSGPDAKGHHTLVIAMGVKQGKEIEKLLKELAGFAGGVADFDFDVEKIGDFSLHKIKLADGPPELDRIFGTKTFWLAVSDGYIALSIEPDGARIKAGLKNKPAAVPMLSIEVAAAKLFPIIATNLKPDESKAVMKDTFGDGPSAGKDTVTVTVVGGEQLTVKAKVKGKAVRLFYGLSQVKN